MALPTLLPFYFGMGWFADWLARPKDHAAAVISGGFLGSVAAVTAFLVAIGWQSLIQIAVEPSKPDLEVLAATIDGNTTYSGGRKLADAFPEQPPSQQPQDYRARLVIKKILADIQSRIPLGLGIGFLLSVGTLLLPATSSDVAGVRPAAARGTTRVCGSFCTSWSCRSPRHWPTLVTWAFLVWQRPVIGCSHWSLISASDRSGNSRGVAALAGTTARRSLLQGNWPWLYLACFAPRHWVEPLFTMQPGGMNFAPVFAGTVAVACAVFQRWPWWARTAVYAVWLATLFLAGARIGFFGAASTVDVASATAEARTRLVVTFLGTGAVLAMTAAMVWRNYKRGTSGFPA